MLSEPVGPAGVVPRPSSNVGQLVVYSGWDDFNTLDADHPRHTPYVLRPDSGGETIRVRNQSGSFGQEPQVVSLAPGRYRVEAKATNLGPMQVPVVVRERKTTVVYLDGVTGPPTASQGSSSIWVREPNGHIVGWRDSEGAR